MPIQLLPDDVLFLVIDQLREDKALYACILVSRTFHEQAVGLLYRCLNSRVLQRNYGSQVVHPATTIVDHPELAQHVLEIEESGDVYDSYVLSAVLQILPLCTRLEKFGWSGSRESTDPAHLPSLLRALRSNTSLRSLTIRTTGSLPDPVYATLTCFTGLTSVSLWVMEGQPRYMQSWTQPLAASLVELRLGRCAGVPATLLVGTLALLTRLHALHVRGVPSAAVPRILARLPSLHVLDTDYVPGMMRGVDASLRLPRLRRLSVTASSMDVEGPMHLWDWIAALLPSTDPEGRDDGPRELGLEAFVLSAFAMQGRLTMPARFFMFLHREHRHTLRKVVLGETQLSLQSLQLLCSDVPFLEEVGCALAAAAAAELTIALAAASRLREAWLHVSWLHPGAMTHTEHDDHMPFLTLSEPTCRHLDACTCHFNRKHIKDQDRFDAAEARQMMMREETPNLRLIAINDAVYTGRWILEKDVLGLAARSQEPLRESDFRFVVERNRNRQDVAG